MLPLAYATKKKFMRSLASIQGLFSAMYIALILYQASFRDSSSLCSKTKVSKIGK
jgi:hypothetical protein